MQRTADVAVIGGGILGLAVARACLQRDPTLHVVVLEKEAAVATHQTTHNSGVLHSGIYYRPGSQKALLCVRGAAEMKRFCAEHALPIALSGKVVVALDDSELPALAELERRGHTNGVEGLRRLSAADIRAIEPAAAGIAGLHVPGTASLDFCRVASAMRDELVGDGGRVETEFEAVAPVQDDDGADLCAVDGRRERATAVVVCAGLQSDRLLPPHERDIRIVPVRGSYFDVVTPSAELVCSMIYPVPDPRLPFLGVHFTRHVDGRVSCGPNAVIALARERYGRWAVVPGDIWSTFLFAGSWRLARAHWRSGLAELWRDVSRHQYCRAARRYLPALREEDLHRGECGVRAQAVDRHGRLLDDFAFRGSGRILHVVNAPSPAATASLAIGDVVAARLLLT